LEVPYDKPLNYGVIRICCKNSGKWAIKQFLIIKDQSEINQNKLFEVHLSVGCKKAGKRGKE